MATRFDKFTIKAQEALQATQDVATRFGNQQLEPLHDLKLANLARLLAERKVQLELTGKARELLFREGYDPQFGVQPLKRAPQRLIQDPLVGKILDGEVLPGESVAVGADFKKGEMTFDRATAKDERWDTEKQFLSPARSI